MHKWMIPIAAIAGISLIFVGESAAARLVAVGYGLAAVALYSATAARP